MSARPKAAGTARCSCIWKVSLNRNYAKGTCMVIEGDKVRDGIHNRIKQMKQKNRILVASWLVAIVTVCFASVQTAHCADQTGVQASPAARTFESSRLSFYEVPLVCPAAPQIGCGSASKPLLLELERSDVVSQAWLNR